MLKLKHLGRALRYEARMAELAEKPTHYLGHLTACDYDAALVPDADQMPLQEVANVMARYLPDGWEVSLCMERGAAWVTLHNPEGDAVSLPDAADKSLTHQLSDALVMAYGLTPNAKVSGERSESAGLPG